MKKLLSFIAGLALTATPAFAFAQTAVTATADVNVSAGADAPTSGSAQGTFRVEGTAKAGTSGTGLTVQEKVASRFAEAKMRAAQEIDRRIENLSKMADRLEAMKRLSDSDKTSLKASLDAQVKILTTLKTTIAAETSTTTLRADIQSITKSYRIYMLVIPQAAIGAAADRVLTIAGLEADLSAKLAARAASSSVDVTVTLADMNAKIADAETQAHAAVTATASLKPDNGDQAVMEANKAALKDARAKVQVAQQYLVAARQDAVTIMQKLGVSARANVKAQGSAEVK